MLAPLVHIFNKYKQDNYGWRVVIESQSETAVSKTQKS